MHIANDMLRRAAHKVPSLVINLSADDHGACSDVIGGPEYSRMHCSLFHLDLYFWRLPSRHRSHR